MKNKDLKKRILDISYKKNLSHLGSCLTAVDIIDEIFSIKKPDEKFILSSGHAGLALYVVLEKYNSPEYGKSAEQIFDHHGVHPDRCSDCGIDCSTGSLGQGLPIALGMALADRKKNVYCLVSDGEWAEGSIHEAIRIKHEYGVDNLKIYMNHNGWAAFREAHIGFVPVDVVVKNTVFEFPFLKGQQAHYYLMTEKDYQKGLELCK